MSTKSTTTLVVLGTLVIGIVIGVLLGGLLREKREQEIDRMLPQRRFQSAMENIIKPTAQQRRALHKILSKRFEQIAKIREQHQSEVFAIYDSLRSDVASILTDEQLQRLETNLARSSGQLVKIRVDRLTNELQLTEDQQKQIEKIMFAMERETHGGRPHFAGNWRDRKRTMNKRIEKLNEEIERVLTPEQKAKYRKMQKEMRPPFRHEFGPPFEPEPGPPFSKPEEEPPPMPLP